jgi:hypothetical protein
MPIINNQNHYESNLNFSLFFTVSCNGSQCMQAFNWFCAWTLREKIVTARKNSSALLFLKSHATGLNRHDFAVQGAPESLAIAGDGFACILSCLQNLYSSGFTFFEQPRDEIIWAQFRRTRGAWYLVITGDGFACVFSWLQRSCYRGRFLKFPDIQISKTRACWLPRNRLEPQKWLSVVVHSGLIFQLC